MCIGSTAIFEGKADSFIIGIGCPDWNSKPIALVTVEKPALIYLGFGFLTFGFLMQLLSVPSPKSLAQMRAEIKAARKLEKLKNEPPFKP